MTKEEALNVVLSEELYKDELDQQYSTYTKVYKEEDKETSVEYKLFHSLAGRRLDGESVFEYGVRKHHVKNYIKMKRKGNFIWFTTNKDTIRNYKIEDMIVKIQKSKEQDTSKHEDKMYQARELAIKTNMGTLNKKELEKFIQEQDTKN